MKIILTGLLLVLWIAGSSQPLPRTLDSLEHRLAATPADTNRVLLLDQLARQLQTSDAARSMRYGEQGLRLARQLHYATGEVLLLSAVGQTYFAQEDLPHAARYYQQAVRRAQAEPRAGRLLTLALLGLGRVAVMQQDYAEGQRYFRQAMRRMQQHLHPVLPEDVSRAQNNLGILYFDWLNSGQPYPDSVKRLALHYNRLALNALRQGNSEAALAVGLNSMALVHGLSKHYDSTEYYHRAALALFQRAGSPYDIAQTQGWLGSMLVDVHRAPEALPLLRSALATANQLHLPALQADCATYLAAALAATGQGVLAYQLANRGHKLLDSLETADRQANLTRLRVQFETEQERSRVRELTQRSRLQALQARRQRQYLWWLGSFLLAVAVGLAVSGGLAWRLRRQHAELVTTRAEQDRLYALIAHDLRSPVMAFNGLADLMTTYTQRQDMARLLGLSEHVRQAVHGLRELLENLLHWALSQRGELRPRPQPLPVAALLTEIDQLYQPSASAAGLTLAVLPTTDDHVLADRNMTRTILRNLVSNALQATPAGGQITVRATATDTAWLQLEVADTGTGMSPEELARVQSPNPLATAKHYRGRAGLGLRLSRLFADAQGGRLTLSSTLGVGTTATLTLPRTAPIPAAS